MSMRCLAVARSAPAAAARARPCADVNAPSPPSAEASHGVNLKAQVLLDRAGFSPGADRRPRRRQLRERAARLSAAERARRLTGELDEPTWSKLAQTSAEPVLIEYTITAADLQGAVRAPTSRARYEEKAELKRLDYTRRRRVARRALPHGRGPARPGSIAARRHSTRPAQRSWSPTSDVKTGRAATPGRKLEVDKREQVAHACSRRTEALLAFYPASIGSEEKPAPSGTLKVRTRRARTRPTPTIRNSSFKGVKARRTLSPSRRDRTIRSGWCGSPSRRRPTGSTALPSPKRSARSSSHGCVRLTNWDALALAKIVRKGTPVEFFE